MVSDWIAVPRSLYGTNCSIPLWCLNFTVRNVIPSAVPGRTSLFHVFIYCKLITIISIQSIPGPKPHHSPFVLQNCKNRALRESVIYCQILKLYLDSFLSCYCKARGQNADYQRFHVKIPFKKRGRII